MWELERTRGALERLRLRNERFMEIRDSEFTTLRTQIDRLIVAVEEANGKRQAAENEVRRLSLDRARRIGFLGQQNRESSKRLRQFVAAHDQWLQERSQLRSELAAAERALEDASRLLNEKTCTIQQLRSDLAQAETRVGYWQRRLQREAAGWRKAEAMIKRLADAPGADEGVRDASVQIQLRDRIGLLEGKVKSLTNLNLRQQRRSTAEILSYQHELAKLKRHRGERAA